LTRAQTLLRRGLLLEYATLGWNVIGVVILAITATAAGSVALAAFGIDSLIEILASTMPSGSSGAQTAAGGPFPRFASSPSGSLCWPSTSWSSPR
jgi:hypothetical protein